MELHQHHAKEVTEALKTLLGRNLDGVIKATLPPDCLLRISYETGSPTTMPAVATPEKVNGDSKPSADTGSETPIHAKIHIGRMAYLPGFNDVWLDDVHIDMKPHGKARLCLQCLAENKAYDEESALHLVDEIDPYVRENGGFIKLATIKIADYFKDDTGQLKKLRQAMVQAAGKNGKYYLKKGAA